MDTEGVPEERIPAEAAETELIRCSSCHRELKSPAERICGDRHFLCDVCYQNLLNPNKKINFEH
jgi:formylmethanofuran dehydrogenase subunit E